MNRMILTFGIALCTLAAWLAAGTTSMAAEHSAEAPKDIVDTAAAAKPFTTLVTAVKAADLVDVLKGKGPFTVFAPTNEAFDKIPKDQLSALLENKEALTAVLTYHVVPGKVMAADVVNLSEADTVQGEPLTIRVQDGKVTINGVNVIKTDIECSNGVIHVLDGVLMPPQ